MPALPSATHKTDPLAERLLRAGHGDEAAFAELYDDMAPRVYGMALRVTGDLPEAEQVARAAFADIWRQAARFDPEQGSALAWMMAVAHRRAVTCVRSTRGTCRHDGPEVAQARSAVAFAAGLPGLEQRAVELAYLDGYTYTDVSTLMRERPDDILSRMGPALRDLCRQS